MATGGVSVPKISLTVPDISLTAPSYLQPDERTTEQPNTAGLDPNIAGNFLAEELSNVSMAKEINWSGDQPDMQGSIPLIEPPFKRTRFKDVVRAMIKARRWKIPIEKEPSVTHLNKIVNDNLRFNVNAFKAGSTGSAGLSNRARYILMKPPWERTEEELELINSIVNRLNPFAKYSNLVRKELARVIEFETFEDGRIIMREGHRGCSMYFIVAGSVTVQVCQVDKRTGEKKSHVVGDIPAGSSFGELALIQDTKRTATIVCKGSSQFLRVDKEDFDVVLKRSYEQEWQERNELLKSLPFFKKWAQQDIRHINLNSKITEHKMDTVIVGDLNEPPEYVYFVVLGSCVIVRKVVVIETTSHLNKGQTMLTLPPKEPETLKLEKSQHLKNRFLVVGSLERGDFFGVGEDLSSIYIITTCKVECLVIPRLAMQALERHLHSKRGEAMGAFSMRAMVKQASERMLSEEETFRRWMQNLRWKNYKKGIMRDIIKMKPGHFFRPKHQKPLSGPGFYAQPISGLAGPLADDKNRPVILERKGGYQLQYDILPPLLPPIQSSKHTKPPKSKNQQLSSSSNTSSKMSQDSYSALKPREKLHDALAVHKDGAARRNSGRLPSATGINRLLRRLVQ